MELNLALNESNELMGDDLELAEPTEAAWNKFRSNFPNPLIIDMFGTGIYTVIKERGGDCVKADNHLYSCLKWIMKLKARPHNFASMAETTTVHELYKLNYEKPQMKDAYVGS